MRTLAVALTTALAVSTIASPLRAGIVIGDIITLTRGVGSSGGIFHVHDDSHPTPNFDTFCAEIEEHLTLNTPYKVSNIGTVTVNGGKSLTPFAAWLYDRFLGHGGGLPNFNKNDFVDVNVLQVNIWASMGYPASVVDAQGFPGLYASYTNKAVTKGWVSLFNTQVTNHTWSGIGSVRIINLKTLSNLNAQDVLVEVPEPISVMIWPLVAMCLSGGWKFHTRRYA